MILKNAKLNGEIKDIKIENGKISDIGHFDGADALDLSGLSVYSGLLDIHTHGVLGFDTMDEESLSKMALYEAENGITSFLPTTMTMDFSAIKKAVSRDISGIEGANIPGFHMEGPYLSKKYKGAQNEEFIKSPDIDEFNSLRNIKIVTIAPELTDSIEFIEKVNAVVSLGHSEADFKTGVAAFKAGAKCLTHTFNAMPPFHHREPSLIGAAIEEGGFVEVISDGLHLHKSVVTALYRIFGSDKMILISDSMRACGMPDGEYEFGGQTIAVKDGVARTKCGAIAGSTSNLFDCVKKAIEFGIPKDEAFKMASQTPASLIGEENKGKIEKGFDADLIAVDDCLNLRFSMVGGKVYRNNNI